MYDGLYNVTVKAVDTSKFLLNTVHLFSPTLRCHRLQHKRKLLEIIPKTALLIQSNGSLVHTVDKWRNHNLIMCAYMLFLLVRQASIRLPKCIHLNTTDDTFSFHPFLWYCSCQTFLTPAPPSSVCPSKPVSYVLDRTT